MYTYDYSDLVDEDGNPISPYKKTDPKVHYLLAAGGMIIGAFLYLVALVGVLWIPYVAGFLPWLLVVGSFFFLPGLGGALRGPGEPSTYLIPRPKQRVRGVAADSTAAMSPQAPSAPHVGDAGAGVDKDDRRS